MQTLCGTDRAGSRTGSTFVATLDLDVSYHGAAGGTEALRWGHAKRFLLRLLSSSATAAQARQVADPDPASTCSGAGVSASRHAPCRRHPAAEEAQHVHGELDSNPLGAFCLFAGRAGCQRADTLTRESVSVMLRPQQPAISLLKRLNGCGGPGCCLRAQ